MSLVIKMSFFENGLKAKVMSTELIIEANLSKKILFEALDIAQVFEAKYSAYTEDSLLAKINQNAGIKAVTCSGDEIEIFEESLKMAKLSGGVFDPTIGALTQGSYGFGKAEAKIPTQKELKEVKKLVDYRDLRVTQNEVYLKKKGMRLDLGGIGKGYIAQKIILFLQSRGATKALVNVGGEICVVGKEYNIAIQDPYSKQILAVVKTSKSSLSLSTSGDYERYIGTKENHHILDKTTAKQNHYYSSVTIIKDGLEGTLLDAVATMVFNAPLAELGSLAKKYNIAIIAVVEEGDILFKNFKDLDINALEVYAL